jgi:hypothetical protein
VPSIRAETTRVAHSIGAIDSAVGGEAPALYLAALGLAVLLFIDLGGSAGLTFILPFLMFISCSPSARTTTSWS